MELTFKGGLGWSIQVSDNGSRNQSQSLGAVSHSQDNHGISGKSTRSSTLKSFLIINLWRMSRVFIDLVLKWLTLNSKIYVLW